MPTLRIEPQTVLLTSGQAVTLQAVSGEDKAEVSVVWRAASIGTLTPADGSPKASAVYTAPSAVTAAGTVVVIAERNGDLASATISLTPDAISLVPSEVQLSANEQLQFHAIVAGAPPAPDLTWILSPPVGELKDGRYKAPPVIQDSTTVKVMACSPTSQSPALATVNLSSPPWAGPGVTLLGAFLLLVFCLVYPLVGLWPPALPNPDAAKANRIEAERALDSATSVLESAEVRAAEADAEADAAKKKAAPAQPDAGVAAAPLEPDSTWADTAKVRNAASARLRANVARQAALSDLASKRNIEITVNDATVLTTLGKVNREIDLLLLVLLAGGLGGFLHMAQSYSEYIGNRTLKKNWAWWYTFRPFIGSALALVFYAAVRGGFMAIATGSNTNASELNPFGLVSIAALVGMFSRAATIKLGEVFDTLFKSDKAKTGDKLVAPGSASSAPASTGGTSPSASK